MTETEVERLVVRLVGDGSQYQTMFKQAADGATSAAKTVEAASRKIESIGNSVTGFARATMGAIVGFGIKGYLQSAFDMFASRETVILRLNAAITANGANVEQTSAKYQEFAAVMKKQYGDSVDTTLGLLRQAETYGLTGDAAERAARKALALSAATEGNTEAAGGMMRMAQALEQGHIKQAMQFARMIPQLRGIRDQTEFLTKANKLLEVGQTTLGTIANSTEGKMKRYSASIKEITRQFGQAVVEEVMPFVEWMTKLLSSFKNLDDGTKRVIVRVAMFASALLMVGPAVQLWKMFAAPVMALGQLILVTAFNLAVMLPLQILSTVAWGAWKVAVLVATIAMMAFNVSTGVGVVAVGLLIAAIGGIGAAAFAVVATAVDLFNIFGSATKSIGPLGVIKGMFGEWFGIIKDIIDAIKVDMPLAWKLTQAGFRLAIEQVKALWPPLWGFVKAGFDASWSFVSKQLKLHFEEALLFVQKKMVELGRNKVFAAAFLSPLEIMKNEEWGKELDKKQLEINRKMMRNVLQAEEDMKAAVDDFNEAMAGGDNDAIKRARENIAAVQKELDIAKNNAMKDAKPPKIDPSLGANLDVAKEINKEIAKFDAVGRHSAEALFRLAEFKEMVAAGPKKSNAAAGAARAAAVPGAGAVGGEDEGGGGDFARSGGTIPLLKEMRDLMKDQAGRPRVEVDVANVA